MFCHKQANVAAFANYGYKYEDVKKKSSDKDTIGITIRDLLKLRRDGAGITEEQIPLEKLINLREKSFLQLVKQEATLYPGAREALTLSFEKEIVNIIVSSGSKIYIELVLKKFDLDRFISFIITADDVKRGKPSPDCYEIAFEKLSQIEKGTGKENCRVVEDSRNGALAAKAAGFEVVYVPPKYSKSEIDVEVEFQLETLEEFEQVLSI